ncbi:MAG: NAD(P)-dependent oxidoreductase [Gammaproteobacteria bacterium]|nr:NAD(P)-dependent oxidoreductase [Gammaproteobacteria bacterium]
MNIALIGASGKIGRCIGAELLQRGHQVTGIARHPERIVPRPGLKAATGDFTLPAPLANVLRGHDAVISAASFIPGQAENLIEAVRASGVRRLLIVGGAASLLTAPDGPRLFDTIQLPEEWKAPVEEGMRTLKLLRGVTDLDWTFFSPAAMIGPGERTGRFRLGTEVVVKDAEGNSRISYDDYAIAMVDELEQGKHLKARFTIGY